MNTNLESAIQEAMTELDRQTAQTMENRLNAKGALKSGKILKKRKARWRQVQQGEKTLVLGLPEHGAQDNKKWR